MNRVGLCSLRTCHRRIAIAILDSNDKKEQQQQTINDVRFSFLFCFPFDRLLFRDILQAQGRPAGTERHAQHQNTQRGS